MKNAMKRIMCMMIAVMLLISAVPAAFAAEGDPELKIVVKINGEATNKPKTVTVNNSLSLTKDFGMSLINQNKENRSVENWTTSAGKVLDEGHVINADWLSKQDADYYVVLNINETKTEPTPDPKPETEKPISVPVNIYVNGEYMRTTSISVPVDGSVKLTEAKALGLLKTTANRTFDAWTSTVTKDATDNDLSYSWLKETAPEGYELNAKFLEGKTEQKPAEDEDKDDDKNDGYGDDDTYYFNFADANKGKTYKIQLHIFMNDKISEPQKTVTLNLGKEDDEFNMADARSIVEARFDAIDKDEGIQYDGLYIAEGDWYGKFAKSDVYTYIRGLKNARTHKDINIYLMINNAKVESSGTADPSNPKTGDSIMIAVSTMALAGAALVSVMELKKRKMI